MATSKEALTVHEALPLIQRELKAPKGNYNSFGKYKYRSCEDILEAVKPILSKYGIFILLTDEIVYIEGRFYVKATVRLMGASESSISVSAYAREDETKKGMDGAQVTGACSSYARKYALSGLFAIDDTADSDALNKESTVTPVPAATAKKDDPEIKALKEEFNAICKNHSLNGGAILKHFNIDAKKVTKEQLQNLNHGLTKMLEEAKETGTMSAIPADWRQ